MLPLRAGKGEGRDYPVNSHTRHEIAKPTYTTDAMIIMIVRTRKLDSDSNDRSDSRNDSGGSSSGDDSGFCATGKKKRHEALFTRQ